MSNRTQQKPNSLAIAALVLSLLMCIPLFPLLGIILGVVALVRTGKDPELSGRGLSIAAIAVGVPGIVMSLGVMAAVAIPAFIGYIRRAKTSEAEERISAMYRSAVRYATTERTSNGGQLQPPSFPASTPLTPSKRCCLNPDGRCQPDPSVWNHPSWQALSFEIRDPHYFQYQFISDGRSFTARAIGDLDCDGITSTFERAGILVGPGEVRGSRGIYRDNPTE